MAARDTHVVQADQATSDFRRRDFGDVERHDHCSGSNTEANDKTSNRHLRNAVRGCLEDGANREKRASNVDSNLAPVLIGSQTGNDGADESTARA